MCSLTPVPTRTVTLLYSFLHLVSLNKFQIQRIYASYILDARMQYLGLFYTIGHRQAETNEVSNLPINKPYERLKDMSICFE